MAASWRKIKNEYIAGEMSYRALAKKHGVSPSTLSKVAIKDGWARARKNHRHNVDTKTADALCARASAREIERLGKLQDAVMGAMDVLEAVGQDPDQFRRHLVTESEAGVGSEVLEKVYNKYDMRSYKAFTEALRNLSAAARDLFDIPGLLEQHAMEMAQARLELERQKAAAGDEDKNEETGIAEIAAALPVEDDGEGATDAPEGLEGQNDGE